MTRWRRTSACERAAQWVSLDLDGELSRIEAAALARHLRRCESCRSSSAEIGAFTMLLRAAPPVEPARAIVVPAPPWAKRTARATLRGGALALAVSAAVFLGVSRLGQPPSPSSGSLEFSGAAAQHAFARDHVLSEPTLYVVANAPSPPSFASRALL
ncbi:MAG TPA: zf-HC2 domain-containing protein [Gaiellaceae bacterium]|jgi:anti-sigma factor RsiW|nr:zf-HC2 domain-containing protein [Gaiellaceae bacterium]